LKVGQSEACSTLHMQTIRSPSPMKFLAFVAGARPNFVKIAPILRALEQDAGVKCLLIHTGQH
jgi:hypothetical protein